MQPSAESRPLIVRFGAMGDMILVTGLMQALHRRYGAPCDVLSSGAWTRPLLQANPDLAQLHLLKSRKRPYLLAPEQWRLVDWLRQRPRGPVYVCDFHSQDKLRWLLERGGVAASDCLYARPEMFAPRMHWFDAWKQFAMLAPVSYAGAGVSEVDYPPVPNLLVDPRAIADLQSFLLEQRLDGPLLLLQPGNKRTLKRGRLGSIGDHKTWPTRNWIELCGRLLKHRPTASIALCGAPAEQALLREIAEGTGSARVHALGEQLPIPRLLALLQRAHSLISIDSGPAHAAAALGCPTVVLFGDTVPENWLPRAPAGIPVIGLQAPPGQAREVQGISVDSVFAAWLAMDERRVDAPA